MSYAIRTAPNLKTAVYVAMDAASTCWEGIPTGTFDDAQAAQIANDLIDWIREHHISLPEENGVIFYNGEYYYRDLLEVKNEQDQ